MAVLQTFLERRWVVVGRDSWALHFQYLSGPIPFNCYVQVNPDMEAVLFRAILGGAPLEKAVYSNMGALCEIHNLNLPAGCFAFNRETGEVRFKMTAYFWGQEFTERTVRNVIDPAIQLLDSYVLSIVHVFVGESLESALARVDEDPGIGTSELCHYRQERHPNARDT
jgi:hypothetical protein